MRRLGRHGVRGGLRGALGYVRDRTAGAALLEALVISLVLSATQLGVVRVLISAFGVAPSDEGWFVAVVAFGFLAGAVPALPGGWGTSDAVVVHLAPRAGVPPSVMLSVWVVYRLFWYAVAIVGAVLALSRRDPVRSARRT